MTIIVLLLLFKDICQYLQNIVLKCYYKLVKPNHRLSLSQKHYTSSTSSNQCRNYRSLLSTSTNALYREQVKYRRGSEIRGVRKATRKIRG